VKRFPHSYGLRVALIQYLADTDPAAWEAAVRELIEIHPADAWARRELACVLASGGRLDEALEAVQEACRLEPSLPDGHVILGHVLADLGRREEARQAFRRAIRLSVDEERAIDGLMAICRTRQEREDELMFIYDELVRQVIFGDGLLIFRDYAAGVLQPETLLEVFREALEVRPDLWHAHCALIRQLTAMGQTDEALSRATRAAEQFPLLPRIWLEKAAVHFARGEPEQEIEALCRAVDINPAWDSAVRTLAEAYQRAGQLQKARETLERALTSEPGNPALHHSLARILARLGEPEASVEHWTKAVRIAPGFLEAWLELHDWCKQNGREQVAVQLARRLVAERPHDKYCWFLLADALEAPEQRSESIEAVDRALQLDPRLGVAYQLRAARLLEDGRPDEALEACRPPAFGDSPPSPLRLSAARILARTGRTEEAIQQCRAIVRDDPGYFPAWQYMADYYSETEQTEAFLEVAQRLVELAPEDPTAWGYLGAAQQRSGDRAAAKQALRRALEISPGYEYAAGELCVMQLEDKEIQAALVTVEATAPHLAPPVALDLRVRVAAACSNAEGAAKALEELCDAPGEEGASLFCAVRALLDARMHEVAEAVLDARMNRPDTPAEVGIAWVNVKADLDRWEDCMRWLDASAHSGALWYAVAEELLFRLGKTDKLPERKKVAKIDRVVGHHQQRLGEHTDTWTAVGRAYRWSGATRKVVRWMRDWREREGVTAERTWVAR